MNVKQFYIDIHGNYDDALSIMMSDSLIERMLNKFINNNLYEQIISSYENKDYRSLFAASHSFKGVTGNLALTPLYEISCIIVEATRNSDDVNIDKEIEILKKEYQLVKDSYFKNIDCYSGNK